MAKRTKNARGALMDFVRSTGDASFTMEQLYEVVWPNGIVRPKDPASNIKVQMHHVRTALAGQIDIQAVRGVGYKFTSLVNN